MRGDPDRRKVARHGDADHGGAKGSGATYFFATRCGVSMKRPAEVMEAMVAMFTSGDLADLEATVHPDYLDHQGLHGESIHGPAGFATVVAAARSGYNNLDVMGRPDRGSRPRGRKIAVASYPAFGGGGE